MSSMCVGYFDLTHSLAKICTTVADLDKMTQFTKILQQEGAKKTARFIKDGHTVPPFFH